MKLTQIALTAVLAIALAVPGVSAATDVESGETQIQCNGTPTNIPLIDERYQDACDAVSDVCDLFDPCPIEAGGRTE